MGLSRKQISRYRTEKRYAERMKELQTIIDDYNESLKVQINKNR